MSSGCSFFVGSRAYLNFLLSVDSSHSESDGSDTVTDENIGIDFRKRKQVKRKEIKQIP